MKLVNSGYGLSIEFREGGAETLVVEKPEFLVDMIRQLCSQTDGDRGEFIVSDGEKEIKFGKEISLILNPFQIDFNDRKILNRLYAELHKTADEAQVDKTKINTLALEALDEILNQTMYSNIIHSLEFEWEKFFQLFEVKLEERFASFAERLAEYIKILVDFFGTRLIIFLHLHAYLEEEEIREVCQTAAYHKVQLLMIEAAEFPAIEDERIHVIDRDRCLITKGFMV